MNATSRGSNATVNSVCVAKMRGKISPKETPLLLSSLPTGGTRRISTAKHVMLAFSTGMRVTRKAMTALKGGALMPSITNGAVAFPCVNLSCGAACAFALPNGDMSSFCNGGVGRGVALGFAAVTPPMMAPNVCSTVTDGTRRLLRTLTGKGRTSASKRHFHVFLRSKVCSLKRLYLASIGSGVSLVNRDVRGAVVMGGTPMRNVSISTALHPAKRGVCVRSLALGGSCSCRKDAKHTIYLRSGKGGGMCGGVHVLDCRSACCSGGGHVHSCFRSDRVRNAMSFVYNNNSIFFGHALLCLRSHSNGYVATPTNSAR